MRRRAANLGIFFREFITSYHTTGAIAPSGRFLASALTKYMESTPAPAGRRILEVGPGTGAVTRHIINSMSPEDRLDLVELNDRFVARLNHRFQSEPDFQAVAHRSQVFHCPVEELPHENAYDLIISGLPLNNFSVAVVQRILKTFSNLLKSGGTLSFYEYIAIRNARSIFSGREDRQRLRGIGQTLGDLLGRHEVRRDWIWLNLPPAWVHHVRL
jgi:phosphatidylethanolamine/phosphatidyl-N-methylethanolamine N-methyltransferase